MCVFTGFRPLLWHAAAHFLTRLGDSLADFEPGVGGALYGCELEGVPVLLEKLQHWLVEEDQDAAGVPDDIDDPEGEGLLD